MEKQAIPGRLPLLENFQRVDESSRTLREKVYRIFTDAGYELLDHFLSTYVFAKGDKAVSIDYVTGELGKTFAEYDDKKTISNATELGDEDLLMAIESIPKEEWEAAQREELNKGKYNDRRNERRWAKQREARESMIIPDFIKPYLDEEGERAMRYLLAAIAAGKSRGTISFHSPEIGSKEMATLEEELNKMDIKIKRLGPEFLVPEGTVGYWLSYFKKQ